MTGMFPRGARGARWEKCYRHGMTIGSTRGLVPIVAFTADNADIKFPCMVPIQQETHEVLLFDIKRHPKCGSRDPLDQALDMQAVMAAIAGYFGGYTSKMQPIGEKQVKQLREATERKVQGEPSRGAAEDFKLYARRLV